MALPPALLQVQAVSAEQLIQVPSPHTSLNTSASCNSHTPAPMLYLPELMALKEKAALARPALVGRMVGQKGSWPWSHLPPDNRTCELSIGRGSSSWRDTTEEKQRQASGQGAHLAFTPSPRIWMVPDRAALLRL